ncbi:glycosyltransferase family 4 protein [Candidatus Uhrbacteria bacterium]|nr:glycosyltransferase family 4 protein [Candidatus Uhrbacteria bacterium]MBI4592566.1 glycosyltransferase family 4 protein [Candidatus Uhrbacteria bacterium]
MTTDLNLLTTKTTGQNVYGIDASSANKEKRTGVENYSRSLIETMKTHQLEGGESVVLYSNTKLDQALGTLPQGWSSVILNWPLGSGWMSLRVSWEMLRRKPNVLFVPGQALPIVCPRAVVTTVHDLAFLRRPDLYEPATRKRLKRATKRAVKKAARIIVPTQATKQDLVELFHVDAARIVVIAEATDTNLYRRYTQEEARSTLQKHRLGTNFFLVVGRLEKKKNITNLIRAFELFKNRRGLGDPFELVFVGDPGYGYDEMKKYFDLSPHKAQIRQLGYIPDEEVAQLMSQAIAYLFPSWYEGFGIPNLEAMAAGTCLISSDIPAHREVVGDAGLLVPPEEPEAWAHALERIVKDGTLRTELVAKGTQRVKQFFWQKTAEQTWEVLRSLV